MYDTCMHTRRHADTRHGTVYIHKHNAYTYFHTHTLAHSHGIGLMAAHKAHAARRRGVCVCERVRVLRVLRSCCNA